VARVTWLVEAGVYGAEAEPLLAEVRRQGMAAAAVPYAALRADAPVVVDGAPLADDACVVGYGTFPFARQIQLHRRWTPGAWCDPANLDCTAYYARFGRFLLNEHYAILPGVEAVRQRDWLFSVFAGAGGDDGDDGEVFVRPTGCQKLFVGRPVRRGAFRDALAPARYDPQTLVVVAAARPVGREWRLVVAGDRVVAGCQYADGGRRSVCRDLPDEVRAFAAEVLAADRWRPDPVFMLDVAESGGRLRLVELGGFSCCWLYACDLPAVLSEVSALAARAHASRA
jgi:hypothetical protein